jgi:hypothetical protein
MAGRQSFSGLEIDSFCIGTYRGGGIEGEYGFVL